MRDFQEIKGFLAQRKNYEEMFIGEDGMTFIVKTPPGIKLRVMISNGMDWDHVSVSLKGKSRLPSYEEMKYVKRLCFENNEWAVEYHPANEDYVSVGPVLHMWRPQKDVFPVPPIFMV